MAKQLGYQTLELNASDKRNAKAVEVGFVPIKNFNISLTTRGKCSQHACAKLQTLMTTCTTTTLNFTGRPAALARKVLILDEVDGMSGGDRGGAAQIAVRRAACVGGRA